MADDDDTTTTETTTTTTPPTPRRRKRNTGKVTVSSRLERRASKVTHTIRETTKWRTRTSDDDDLDFVHTVQRDAEPVGYAIASVAEHFKPAGAVIDYLFGEASVLTILVNLMPTVRAARRELAERARLRKERRAAEAEARAAAEGPDARVVAVNGSGRQPIVWYFDGQVVGSGYEGDEPPVAGAVWQYYS